MSNERPATAPRSNTADDDLAARLGALRDADRDRFLQLLVAPGDARPALLALFEFNLELARIADHVREPMAGLIRLQWWRDGLRTLAEGAPPAQPVLVRMAEAGLVARLGVDALAAMVDAREAEVDATPLKRTANVEAHARSTAGMLNGHVAKLLGADESVAAAARDAGTAYGLLGILRAVPFVLRRPQPLLPEEPLARSGLTPGALTADSAELAALRPVLVEIGARARELSAKVRRRQARRHAAAFALLILARQDLARLEANNFDVFDGRLGERPPWTAARLVAAATLRWY